MKCRILKMVVVFIAVSSFAPFVYAQNVSCTNICSGAADGACVNLVQPLCGFNNDIVKLKASNQIINNTAAAAGNDPISLINQNYAAYIRSIESQFSHALKGKKEIVMNPVEYKNIVGYMENIKNNTVSNVQNATRAFPELPQPVQYQGMLKFSNTVFGDYITALKNYADSIPN